MSPHLERRDNEGNWQKLPKTKHNRDPKNRTWWGQWVHGILEDTEGVREVGDSQGKPCFERGISKQRRSGDVVVGGSGSRGGVIHC